MLWLKVILLIVTLVNVRAVENLVVSNRRVTQPIQGLPRPLPRPTLVRLLSKAPEEKVVEFVTVPSVGTYYQNDAPHQTHQNHLPYLRQGPRTSQQSVTILQRMADASDQQDNEENIVINTVPSSLPSSLPSQSKIIGILVENSNPSPVDLPVVVTKESEKDVSEDYFSGSTAERADPNRIIFPENMAPSVSTAEIINDETKPIQNTNIGSDTLVVVKQPASVPITEFGVYEKKPVTSPPEPNPVVIEKVVVKIEPEQNIAVQTLPEPTTEKPTNTIIIENTTPEVTPSVLKPVEVITEPRVIYTYKPNPNPTSFVAHYVPGNGDKVVYRPKPERPTTVSLVPETTFIKVPAPSPSFKEPRPTNVNEGLVVISNNNNDSKNIKPTENNVVIVETNKTPEILPVGIIVEQQVPVTNKPRPTSVVAHYLPGSEDNVMYRPKPERPSVVTVVPQPSPTVTIISTEVQPRPKPAIIAPPPPLRPTTVQIPSYIAKTPLVSNPVSRPFVNPIGIQLMDYKCRDAFGYNVVQNDCESYVECQQNVAYKFECPDGLRFNRNTVWPEYPCSYSWEIQCESSAFQRAAQPTAQCPRQYGYFALQNGDCSNYIICQEGVATVMNCPAGLVFNPDERICDWPERVPSCRPKVFVGFTCPSINDEDEGYIRKFRYGTSCKEYIACQRGQPRLLSCDAGLAFDEQSQVCVDSDYIKNCTR